MKELSLVKLAIKNFRSFSDETVTFPQTRGLKLLSGENIVEPRLGANGSGKSSLWDALEWCLHGASVRGAKTSSIVSWGTTQTEVIAILNLGNINHTIRRYGPPMKIELNDKPATQEEIDACIGLSRQRFLHSVVFGQGVPLFPDLSIPERGVLLDDVLSLNIWQLATDAASKRCSFIESNINKNKLAISFLEGKISGLPSEQELESKIKLWEEDKSNNITFIKNELEAWNTKQDLLQNNLLQSAEEKMKAIEAFEAEIAPLVFELENQVSNPFSGQIAILEQQHDETEKLLKQNTKIRDQASYEYSTCERAEGIWTKDVCPTCSQPITENKKKHELECVERLKSSIKEKIDTAEQIVIKAEISKKSYFDQLQELRAISIREDEKKRSIRREVDRVQSQIKILEHEGKRILKQLQEISETQENPFTKKLSDLEEKKNPFIKELADVKKERVKLVNEFATTELDYKKLEASMLAAEYWKHGFKRIRLYFVKQVLAALELEIQSAISALGLEGWKVALATESETKSQTIKLGIQIHISSPISEGTWDVWSGGETQRLRLAIAMGLASLIQRASGTMYSFEIWDEPTKHLSGEGVEDLLEALRYRADILQKQIWLTDHSALTFSGFREIWSAVKESSGTKIVKLSESEI